MVLKTIFDRPVDRPIEGVIKADDDSSLRLEVDEYVLTNEVAKRLESFLDAYNNYAGANGVWISGFFGSGKSHLLKMLALLLENRTIDGKTVLDLFLPKCRDNEILRGDLKRAVSIPSRSILFNIDQKADVISKTQVDALLAVFMKVFDEMCGYYGKQGHIAQFERDLDGRGLYEKFKTSYQAIAGKPWETGREQALLESHNIAEAYAKASEEPKDAAMGILDKYRNEYKVSIEDFAEKVRSYIDRQTPDFRLNFFVDEVGQYIADNRKLKTNLQTIAETLATKCKGRAWIIVTAQEDYDTVLGEMSEQEGDDFSKIQDRFKNRMKLTSADVAEVIQRRLLIKNEEGVEKLSDVYHAQVNNFKTLFDFVDGSQTYRNFQDREHFIHCYPFIPYQFTLFQLAIQNLSQHSAFEGRHSSVGERSMLGVFQQVAIHISDHKLGQLATFDLMFEGIRTTLKSQNQQAISKAEAHLDNPFAVRLLKALFLVKYVRGFNATARNLHTLVLDSFDEDLPRLRERVQEALNLLEQQTYIQRNGEMYEFLTDEEKDVEQEIKNTEVEATDVSDELAKLLFDHVIKNRKIRYEQNGQDYPFSRKLDDRLVGREQELTIHVVSPFHENAENEGLLKMQSAGRSELLVILPPDDRLVRDILMYKRTEKYIRQNISTTQQDIIKRILTEKSLQNRERYSSLEERTHSLLSKAKLFAMGDEIVTNGENPQARIVKGFHELILRVYPNLRMLRGINYTESNIASCLDPSIDGLFKGDATVLSESEQEMLAFIQSNSRDGVRTTLKSLVEKFERKPYGWYFAAILCTCAKLCARGKVELRSGSNLLENSELEQALRNTHEHPKIILEPQIDFTATQVRLLKEFYQDFFDSPPKASEGKALGRETSTAFQTLLDTLSPLAEQTERYPFLSALKIPLEKISELAKKPYVFHLTELARQREDLLDLKEDVLEPIRRFLSGPLKDLYRETKKYLDSQNPNFSFVEGDEATRIEVALADPDCYKGNQMQQVKTLVDTLRQKVADQLKSEKDAAVKTITGLKTRMSAMDEWQALTAEQREELVRPFDGFSNNLNSQTLIAVIRENLRQFEDGEYKRALTKMCELAQPKPEKKTGFPNTKETFPEAHEHKVEYISSKSIQVDFDKAWLTNEADVDRYMLTLKKAFMAEIESGKRVQI